MYAPITIAILSALATAVAHAIEIDGRIAPGEWDGAQHTSDFRLTQPLSRAPAPQPTEAWISATPEGLAIAFRNLQHGSVPRTRQRAQRDQGGPMDRVNLYVDFDGDGRTGYNFTLLMSGSIVDGTITSENQFNSDWDGDWLHATSEDEAGWTAEMLIPWHIAPMRKGGNGMRTIGLSLDLVLGATGERASWPTVSFNEPRFLSKFESIELPLYSQSLLAITPYVVGVHDAIGRRAEFQGGGDIFWKPNGQFQLSATVNPDFGQVESDELVVNFGAVETFFNDKRPFFTENQGFFDVPFGSLGNANRLFYTRRVGGPRDDGLGPGDVTAALRLNGSFAGLNYGVFAASKGDNVGRDFYVARVTRDFAAQGLGATVTHVRHPLLDREADAYAVDHNIRPTPQWNIRTTAVGASVDQAGITTRDSGAQMRIDHDMGQGWRQQLYLLHLGGNLQLNDLGFLERKDLNQARYEVARRLTQLPVESAFSAHAIRAAVSTRYNDNGDHLAETWSVNRRSERRDGGSQTVDVTGWTAGQDDLLTRGNGLVRTPAKLFAYFDRFRPRRGHWAWYANARYAADGLGGAGKGAVALYFVPTYHVNDILSVTVGLEARHDPDWLLWRGGNLLGHSVPNRSPSTPA